MNRLTLHYEILKNKCMNFLALHYGIEFHYFYYCEKTNYMPYTNAEVKVNFMTPAYVVVGVV